jgi:hypothetical protein
MVEDSRLSLHLWTAQINTTRLNSKFSSFTVSVEILLQWSITLVADPLSIWIDLLRCDILCSWPARFGNFLGKSLCTCRQLHICSCFPVIVKDPSAIQGTTENCWKLMVCVVRYNKLSCLIVANKTNSFWCENCILVYGRLSSISLALKGWMLEKSGGRFCLGIPIYGVSRWRLHQTYITYPQRLVFSL